MDEDEEIYDDALSFQQENDSMAGLRDIRSKFENKEVNKPVPLAKPHIPVGKRWEGGGKFKTAENSSRTTNTEHSVARETGNNQITSRLKSPNITTENDLPRRDSKVDIPPIFQKAAASIPAVPAKPKPSPKPVPANTTSDTNNNSSKGVLKKMAVFETSTDEHKAQKPSLPERRVGVSGGRATPSSPRTAEPDNDSSTAKDKLDKPPPSVRAGSVQAMASMLGGKIPTNVSSLKAGLKPVSQQQSPSTPLSPRSEGSIVNTGKEALLRDKSQKGFPNKQSVHRKKVISVIRNKDRAKFHQIEVESLENGGQILAKPKQMDITLDLENLADEFEVLVKTLGGQGWKEVQEEDVDIRPVSNRAVSLIEPMTEDDEEEWHQAGFPGLPTDNQLADLQEYDDTQIAMQEDGDGDDGELYEPLPDEFDEIDEPPPVPGPKPSIDHPPPTPTQTQTDTHKQSEAKELEKERKKKEKEEKKRQEQLDKELKQKQKDLQQLLKKYKITEEGLEVTVGKGMVKASKKAQKLDIAVTEGDKVDIVRMVDNQKGKWLIRIVETKKIGFVDAANIQVMEGCYSDHIPGSPTSPNPPASNGVSEEVYEDVDGKPDDDLIEEDIYEECS